MTTDKTRATDGMAEQPRRVAVVTGAARGQGRSHSVTLARRGMDLAISDICGPISSLGYQLGSEDDLEMTRKLVEQEGARCVSDVVDVRDSAQLDRHIGRAIDRLGRVDCLVANAGIAGFGRAWELSDEEWQDTIDVCLTGVWRSARAVIPHMISRKTGSIVMTSSVAGKQAMPDTAHYVAAKTGVVGLMRALAMELGPYGIRVNAVHPTVVETPMVTDNPALAAWLADGVADSHGGNRHFLPIQAVEPVDISHAIAWLLSEEARFVTGVSLPVDAGHTAG